MTELPILTLVVFTPAPGRLWRCCSSRAAPIGAIRWVALLASLVSFGFSLALLGYDPAGAGVPVRRGSALDRGVRDPLHAGRRWPVRRARPAHHAPLGDLDLLLLGADPDAREGVLHRAAAADGRHAGRVRLARPVPVLRLLGGQPHPDVPGHRDLGRSAPHLRDREVRDLHAGRIAAHARRDPGRGDRARQRDRQRSRSATRRCAASASPTASRRCAFIAFFLAFAIKVPMWPLHTWLPDAHVEAPTAGSILLAGVLLKLGGYGFLRFSIPLLPDAAVTFAPIIIGLAVIAILYGALVAMVQPDLKKLVAYSSVSHMGFVMLGAFVFNEQGLQGAVVHDDQPRHHHRRAVPAGRHHLRADPRPADRAHGRAEWPGAALRRDLRPVHLRQHRAARAIRLRRRVPRHPGRVRLQRLGGGGRDAGRDRQRRLHAVDVPARLLHRAIGLDAPMVVRRCAT